MISTAISCLERIGDQVYLSRRVAKPPSNRDTNHSFHLFIQTVSLPKGGEKQSGCFGTWILHLASKVAKKMNQT